jgi:hypothetical protein
LRATNVLYARAVGAPWVVNWTAYNCWLCEVVREGTIEVSPFASAAELKAAVKAAVYRVDALMWARIETWAVGDRLALNGRSIGGGS